MISEDFSLVRLTQDYTIKPFNCEDDDLNGFLFDNAKPASKELIAITYLLETDTNTIGFFCVSNDKITADDTRGRTIFSTFRLLKFQDTEFDSMHSYPAVKIGRLGVDKAYQGQGFGRWILDYLKFSFIDNNKTGCRFITVDAYERSLGFYERSDFIYLTEKDNGKDTRLMYFDLSTLQ